MWQLRSQSECHGSREQRLETLRLLLFCAAPSAPLSSRPSCFLSEETSVSKIFKTLLQSTRGPAIVKPRTGGSGAASLLPPRPQHWTDSEAHRPQEAGARVWWREGLSLRWHPHLPDVRPGEKGVLYGFAKLLRPAALQSEKP